MSSKGFWILTYNIASYRMPSLIQRDKGKAVVGITYLWRFCDRFYHKVVQLPNGEIEITSFTTMIEFVKIGKQHRRKAFCQSESICCVLTLLVVSQELPIPLVAAEALPFVVDLSMMRAWNPEVFDFYHRPLKERIDLKGLLQARACLICWQWYWCTSRDLYYTVYTATTIIFWQFVIEKSTRDQIKTSFFGWSLRNVISMH